MTMTGLEADTATAYRRFATNEARGNSPIYEAICLRIADDDAVLSLIATLPAPKRQPNLVLGAARYLDAPSDGASSFVNWLREHWDEVRAVALSRATQTNEVGRCATLLPFIADAARAAGDGRIALVEVGCSAGLALYPDLYVYEYVADSEAGEDPAAGGADDEGVDPGGECKDAPAGGALASRGRESSCDDEVFEPREASGPVGVDGIDGVDRPLLTCVVAGALDEMTNATPCAPTIAWRGGLDLNPLDVLSDDPEALDNARWLRALVWPGQDERASRLAAAIDTVRRHVTSHPEDAAHIVRGDVVDDLERLVAQVPGELHLVLFHSAVLAYVDDDTRARFERRLRELTHRPGGFTWISNEAPSVMPGMRDAVAAAWEPRDLQGRFVLAVDGQPRALTGPHGQSLTAWDATN